VNFEDLRSAKMTGAEQVRIVTMTPADIYLRAREGLIFAHPKMPALIRKLVRRGSLDFLLAGARQALRDIEKPVDLITHEGRAAAVLALHRPLLEGLDPKARAVVAQVAVTSIRIGNRDYINPPSATIQGGGLGLALLTIIGVILAVAALAVAL
jgi:hypothetical protein